MNILIIDDSIVDRKIMGKVIRDGIGEVYLYENDNGEEVVKQIQDEDIKLVILDIMLPEKSGLSILRELKEDIYTQDIPVIVCSGLGDDETIRKTLALGAYDYFEKPLSDRAVRFSMALKVRNALELVKRTEKINYLRDHDHISNLHTRRYFEYNLNRFDKIGYYPLTYLMLDIDGLKIINDAYGRLAGDRIIRAIGHFIKQEVEGVHLSARWGSDEFILLLSDYTSLQCETLVQSLKTYLESRTHTFHGVNISFGYAVKRNNQFDTSSPIQEAEENLYSNKILESNSVRGKLLESITHTLQQKNPREESHSRRVGELSELIARELGFSEFEVKKVRTAGMMHDVGKIIIDESILNKPGKLNHEEWEQVKKHPQMGFRILSASTDTIDIARAALSHHERYDGKGYPQGLAGDDIPLMGRIICVADSYDAMTGPRTYKEVFSQDQAIAEIIKNKGTQFDPDIADAFIRVLERDAVGVK